MFAGFLGELILHPLCSMYGLSLKSMFLFFVFFTMTSLVFPYFGIKRQTTISHPAVTVVGKPSQLTWGNRVEHRTRDLKTEGSNIVRSTRKLYESFSESKMLC